MDEPTLKELSDAKTVRALAGNIIALCEGWPPEHVAAACAMALGFVIATEMEDPHEVLDQTHEQLVSVIDDFKEAQQG